MITLTLVAVFLDLELLVLLLLLADDLLEFAEDLLVLDEELLVREELEEDEPEVLDVDEEDDVLDDVLEDPRLLARCLGSRVNRPLTWPSFAVMIMFSMNNTKTNKSCLLITILFSMNNRNKYI